MLLGLHQSRPFWAPNLIWAHVRTQLPRSCNSSLFYFLFFTLSLSLFSLLSPDEPRSMAECSKNKAYPCQSKMKFNLEIGARLGL
ncbi:hypothetical protein RchiOBHm_Chr4g0390021 [Rosa chinensis]|uniref:Uncharacterized protein n=1 Tax=Rosa chinensis TaxID=74649 RepID=A0A2P6QQ48_ROSCH|nr:hypothetical protein RchiOBHm_Chr4g0390021 [Rosa chinensis]